MAKKALFFLFKIQLLLNESLVEFFLQCLEAPWCESSPGYQACAFIAPDSFDAIFGFYCCFLVGGAAGLWVLIAITPLCLMVSLTVDFIIQIRLASIFWLTPAPSAPSTMDDCLLLTLALEGAAEGSAEEKLAADAFIAGLVADLHGLEAVSATAAAGEQAEPGSKALGPLLLGVLKARVKGGVALKVVRFLCERVLDQPRPFRLTLERQGRDGVAVKVELEGSLGNQESKAALLSQAEEVMQRLR